MKRILTLGLAVGLIASTWVNVPQFNRARSVDSPALSKVEIIAGWVKVNIVSMTEIQTYTNKADVFPRERAGDSLFWRNIIYRL